MHGCCEEVVTASSFWFVDLLAKLVVVGGDPNIAWLGEANLPHPVWEEGSGPSPNLAMQALLLLVVWEVPAWCDFDCLGKLGTPASLPRLLGWRRNFPFP